MRDSPALQTSLEEALHLTPKQKQLLAKLGLFNVEHMLRYAPSRYEAVAPFVPIAELAKGARASFRGQLSGIKTEKTWRRKMPVTKATLTDHTGSIQLIWFHQPYIGRTLKEGVEAAFTGTVGVRGDALYCSNPIPRALAADKSFGQGPLPIYPETRGISSRWFQFNIRKLLSRLSPEIEDPIPADILKRYHLPRLVSAFVTLHAPRAEGAAEAARKRFAFEEILYIQLGRMRLRAQRDAHPAFSVRTDTDMLAAFTAALPFSLTGAQTRTIAHVLDDLARPRPMSRLVEGDVGSGKTVIALAAAYSAIQNGYQVAYMAPTEVLARQHFATITELFRPFNIPVGLITGSECEKFPSKISGEESTHISKAQLLKWTESHAVNFVVGTHALIQKNVQFKRLALVIIDEQHRFGINQRFSLTQKGGSELPHLLSMTATPIPRTLALTIYGDLDLSLLDELPPERKRTITEIIPHRKRDHAYAMIRKQLEEGRQAYVICPRIEESQNEKNDLLALAAKNVTQERERLSREIFPDKCVGMLHGKMRPKEKTRVMEQFRNGELDILVATSVIEVGVDVPNATIIIIEGADRFGLAQLHQLRGRVARSFYTPHCLVFSESSGSTISRRLRAFQNAKNGFELAEHDLALRGPGELSGTKQWGISDLGMEALKNIKMVEAARTEAQQLLERDPMLTQYPQLCERVAQTGMLHLE